MCTSVFSTGYIKKRGKKGNCSNIFYLTHYFKNIIIIPCIHNKNLLGILHPFFLTVNLQKQVCILLLATSAQEPLSYWTAQLRRVRAWWEGARSYPSPW